MKKTLLALALLAAAGALQAAPWTYNGRLNDGGKPANGQYDLRVTLLNDAKTASVTSPITLYSVNVVDGSFSVDVDFGIDLNSAPVMALKTEVQQGGSGFVSLGEPKRFDAKAALGGVCWDLAGNAGTTSADFLGTTDNEPMTIRTNNRSAIRMEPSAELVSGNTNSITNNIIAGSYANGVIAPARGATIAGGGAFSGADPTYTVGGSNRVDDHYGTIGGGFDNQAGSDSGSPTDGAFATVGGGRRNTASGRYSVIGGGENNEALDFYSTVAGGEGNIALGNQSTVSGGSDNQATGFHSTVSGGRDNCAGGDFSWVGGDSAKTRVGNAVGDGTCAPSSGDSNGDEGSFVWADRSVTTDFVSAQPNQFIVRAANGVGINTATGSTSTELTIQALDNNASVSLRSLSGKTTLISALEASGTTSITTNPDAGSNRIQVQNAGVLGSVATLSNGGTWTNASSRSYKENFTAVNGLDVLRRLVALPIMTWDYIGSGEGLHMGPVAEDFKASFGLAGDGKSISTVDADGIALAAIQGLNAKLESENAALRARLDALEARAK